MRYLLLVVPLLLLPGRALQAEISIGVGVELPGVEIGVQIPAYPQLIRVPGHPVFYAPHIDYNFFFFDGLYWVFSGDRWYASVWFDGPWELVEPDHIPVYLLRIPVRYYRRPPPYFLGWHRDEAPRWGEHWGGEWHERHRNWERGERRSTPPAAPLPYYQRKYQGERYPRERERQHVIRSERYHYQPREESSRRYYAPGGGGGHKRERNH